MLCYYIDMEKNVNEQSGFDFVKMVADYMEEGLLDNILAMLRADKSEYPIIGKLITDERIRVRLGTTALVEILTEEEPENIKLAAPSIINALGHENPTVRGDAANLLGIMGYKEAVPLLEKLLQKEKQPEVREMVKEAIDSIATTESQ